MGLENSGKCCLYGLKCKVLKRNSRSRERTRKLAPKISSTREEKLG